MERKSIVFDIFGVLFFVRIQAILQHIGIGKLFFYTLRNRKTPFHTFFTILDKMRTEVPGEFQDLVLFQGYYLPKSICDWQRGLISSKMMLERLIDYINQLYQQGFFNNQNEKDLILKAAMGAFEAHQLAHACILNEAVAKTTKKLKHESFGLYILSNIDEDLFSDLRKKNASFFDQFDGIVTSYETQLLKPEREIYLYLVDRYQLEPPQCCFIDDQKENVIAAEKIGMKGIVYKKGEDVEKKIKGIF